MIGNILTIQRGFLLFLHHINFRKLNEIFKILFIMIYNIEDKKGLESIIFELFKSVKSDTQFRLLISLI